MSYLSSVEVRLKASAPACVLDAGLALSPHGLLLALRLAREWPVWLVRGMWAMIDSDQLYRERPQLVAAMGEPADRVGQLIDTLGDWRAAWIKERVKGFHWPGDHRHESDFPEDADESLLPRFEALVDALTGQLEGESEPATTRSWRRSCACEALALSAALQTRPTLVLAALETDAPPLAVAIWEELTGQSCPPQRFKGKSPVVLPPGLSVGLMPLFAGDLALAAIHVAAPRALMLPRDTAEDLSWPEAPPEPPGCGGDPWQGARLSWHRLA